MANDPLDNEISVGAELTPTGLNAKAKSRFMSGLDRLLGNLTEYPNVAMERRHSLGRAKIEADKQLVEAMTKIAIDRLGTDREFAERVLRNHFGLAFGRQENKDGVVRHAIEDLRRNPVADEEGDDPPELDAGFINKFERHAEDAGTEQLREKWGRVFAAEVRRPGSVTAKVMRIVDEIDAETAGFFEKLNEWRIGVHVPRCLSGEMPFRMMQKLVGSNLIVDPGMTGQLRLLNEATADSGFKTWFTAMGGKWGLAIRRDAEIPAVAADRPLTNHQGVPAIPVYILTDEGAALAQILTGNELTNLQNYVSALRSFLPAAHATIFEQIGGVRWTPIDGDLGLKGVNG